MKVENFYNKNQFIIFGGDAIVTFQSYNSIIAKIDNEIRRSKNAQKTGEVQLKSSTLYQISAQPPGLISMLVIRGTCSVT